MRLPFPVSLALAFLIIPSASRAQQGLEWPLCGILSVDSLAQLKLVIRAAGAKEEALGFRLTDLYDDLYSSHSGAVSALPRSSGEGQSRDMPRGSSAGFLRLEVAVSTPAARRVALRESWLLLIDDQPTSGEAHPWHLAWYHPGPLAVVPEDSLAYSIRSEAARLVAQLPSQLQRCRHLAAMKLGRNAAQ